MRVVRSVAAPLIGLLTFFMLWELAVRVFDIRRFVLLAPSAIISEFLESPSFYLENALVTARHMVIGLSVSLVVAIAVGAVMASSRFVEEATQPVEPTPVVTEAPRAAAIMEWAVERMEERYELLKEARVRDVGSPGFWAQSVGP